MKEFIKKFIPLFLINCYHFLLSFLAVITYRFPSFSFGGRAEKLKVIAVTGTNGKSTVVEMVSKILEESGYSVASLSSIKFKVKDKEWPNVLRMTMPGRLELQRFLRRAVNENCHYAVLEVTSEGIKQHRHRFIDFDVAVLTNLSPEHIEAHGSFEKYREAKGKLFEATKRIHVINLDDDNASYFLNFPAEKKYGYKIGEGAELEDREKMSILYCSSITSDLERTRFELLGKKFQLQLLGRFNVYNALAAISVGLSQGVELDTCKGALEKMKNVPGRMERITTEPFLVFVDYAFTPNALEKVYKMLSIDNKHKLICVLGAAGGGRDKWKRPVLGGLASRYCDKVIITNEDPYDEDPLEIINQIAGGVSKRVKKIIDRREAIRESLKLAKEKDRIVITGKGSEPSICLAKGKKIPWDDRKVVREELQKLWKKGIKY